MLEQLAIYLLPVKKSQKKSNMNKGERIAKERNCQLLE
jgi:hypothetical protein